MTRSSARRCDRPAWRAWAATEARSRYSELPARAWSRIGWTPSPGPPCVWASDTPPVGCPGGCGTPVALPVIDRHQPDTADAVRAEQRELASDRGRALEDDPARQGQAASQIHDHAHRRHIDECKVGQVDRDIAVHPQRLV